MAVAALILVHHSMRSVDEAPGGAQEGSVRARARILTFLDIGMPVTRFA